MSQRRLWFRRIALSQFPFSVPLPSSPHQHTQQPTSVKPLSIAYTILSLWSTTLCFATSFSSIVFFIAVYLELHLPPLKPHCVWNVYFAFENGHSVRITDTISTSAVTSRCEYPWIVYIVGTSRSLLGTLASLTRQKSTTETHWKATWRSPWWSWGITWSSSSSICTGV